MTVDATGRHLFGTLAYAGTRLDTITNLQYSTYQSSAIPLLALTLQFDMDYDLTDTNTVWQGRLVFEPYFSGTVTPGTWQTWTPLTGVWWASSAPGNTQCPQASPCTWAQVLNFFPNAGLRANVGALQFKAGGPWLGGFDGSVDAFIIGVSGSNTTFNFEPETPCTTVCYVDAVNGNDTYGGDTISSAKRTIQAAIDQVSAGGAVRVLPGTYSETAANRFVLNSNGPHQFGLFFDTDDKDGITVMGVTAGDVPITSFGSIQATVTTNATNNFGYSGIFVEADNITIQGLRIGDNAAGNNKTIEIIGDGFTLRDSHVQVSDGGSVYFNDWQFDTVNNASHIETYTIEDNWIDLSASIDLTSGAGLSGPVSGRTITGNTFTNGDYWPSISFNGADTGVPWFVQSVGGAVITGNTFTNTFTPSGSFWAQHIRARGTYDDTQFDWQSYWNDNTYNRATAVIEGTSYSTTFDVRPFTYTSGPYTFNNTRRIGAYIQQEVANVLSGDMLLVNQGTYVEQVDLDRTMHLFGEDGALLTSIQAPSTLPLASSIESNIVDINGAGIDVEVNGFTITGPGPSGCGSIARGIYVRGGAFAEIHDNRILDIRDNPISGCQNGVGIQVGRVADSTNGSANIYNNTISGYQKNGITVSNNASSATISNNTITGAGAVNFIAQNGVQVSGGADASIDGNTISGHSYTPFTFVSTGMLLLDADTVNVDGNTLSENQVGIYDINSVSSTLNGNLINATSAGTGSLGFWGIIVDGGTSQVTNNELDSDDSAGGTGLEFDAGFGASSTNVTATNNHVRNWDVGVVLYQCVGFGYCTSSVFGTLDVNLNNISGNTVGMQVSDASVDAERNWWNSVTGPTNAGNPVGTGDSVVENGTADVDFVPWLCDGTDTSAAVGFQPNVVTDCLGSITIVKDANPNDGQDFTFTSTAGAIPPLDDDSDGTLSNSYTIGGLTPDTSYTITEDAVAGWTLYDLVCTSDNDDDDEDLISITERSATINLGVGEDVTCTFYNRPTTGAQVTKFNDDDGDGTRENGEAGLEGWDFTVYTDNTMTTIVTTGTTDANGSLQLYLVPGTYYVCETLQAGWTNSTPLCQTLVIGAGANVVPGPNSVDITLADGRNSTYRIEFVSVVGNTWTYRVTELSGTPSVRNLSHWLAVLGQCQAHYVAGSGSPSSGLEVGTDGSTGYTGVKWNVTSSFTTGLFSFTLDGAYPTGSIGVVVKAGTFFNAPASIAGPDCSGGSTNPSLTFGNYVFGSITIIKDAVPNDGENFSFTGTAPIGSFQLDDDNNVTLPNSATFNVPPGSYTITEGAESDWYLSNLTCTGTDQTDTIDLAGRSVTINISQGENVTCTFENTALRRIRITKFNDTNRDGTRNGSEVGLNGWTFTVYAEVVPGIAQGTQVATGVTAGSGGSTGRYTTVFLRPGTYSVCETLQANWHPSPGATYNATYGAWCRSVTLAGGSTSNFNLDFGNYENRPPDAQDDGCYIVAENGVLNVAAPGVLGNDSDPDNDPLTIASYTQPAHGTVVLNADGSFTYTPNASYSGADSFTYTLSDGFGGTDTATVCIDVTNVLPTVTIVKEANDTTVNEGDTVTFTLTITNTSPESVTITALSDDYTLSGECTGLLEDVLQPDELVSCTYTVTFTDAGTFDNTATVTVTDDEQTTGTDDDEESVTVADVLPTVTITKSADPTTRPEPGGDFVYTLTITNTSPEPVTITALSDDYPLSTECSELVGVVLQPDEQATCSYTVTHTAVGVYEN
ncbi:MAG: cadherin-like domain-containing protein, partial [Chloroflexi bacterium]|nr:cadherin-like domain-containing protein [Chloroflexota bacterium]